MDIIECEKCKKSFETETIEVPEHVEFKMCKECFDESE